MSVTLEVGAQSFVLLRLGDRQFALPADRIAELVPASRVFHFPHRTPQLEGVILRRGRIVPVCDVSEALTGRRMSSRRLYLLALRHYTAGMETVAIPVTGECELITTEMTAAEGEHPPHVQGWLSNAGNVIEVLQLDHLIPGPELLATPDGITPAQEALS